MVGCQGPIRLPTLPLHGLRALSPYPGQWVLTWWVITAEKGAGVVRRVVLLVVVHGARNKITRQVLLSPQPGAKHLFESDSYAIIHSQKGLKIQPEARPRSPPGWSPSGTNETIPELVTSHL